MADNMPIGNGELVANVLVNASDGSIVLLLGRSDGMSSLAMPIKVGRIKVLMQPSPFVHADAFTQVLHLGNGTLEITGRNSNLAVQARLWVDTSAGIGEHANAAAVLHVQLNSSRPVAASVVTDLWRGQGVHNATKNFTGSCYSTCADWQLLDGDTVTPPSDLRQDEVASWHLRNTRSIVNSTLRAQHLDDLVSLRPDPLIHRSIGALVTLCQTAATSWDAAVFTSTTHLADPEGWLPSIRQSAAAARELGDPAASLSRTVGWWAQFWNRSWLVVTNRTASAGSKASVQAWNTSRGYALSRYLGAIQSRGRLPARFNGGTVTWGSPRASENPDYRFWGGAYWFQNTRHIYWPMITAGDEDLMEPFFRMYTEDAAPAMAARARVWLNASGVAFAETAYPFGAITPTNYGCKDGPQRHYGPPKNITDRFIRYHYEGAVELCFMMLRAYQHSGSQTLLEQLLSFCTEVLKFYDSRYKTVNGTLYISPAQALETFPDCDDPSPEVSALHRILPMLLALPTGAATPEQHALFLRMRVSLPDIPMRLVPSGGPGSTLEKVVSPCRIGGRTNLSTLTNHETPSVYSLWPYGLFSGRGGEGLRHNRTIGMATFAHGVDSHMNFAWGYDGPVSATLGLAQKAWSDARDRYCAQGTTDSSKFPGYLVTQSGDGCPQLESGGLAMETLQLMLLQSDPATNKVYLLPAWPRSLDVEFKLHAPGATVIEGQLRNGTLLGLKVTPAQRRADVVVVGPG